jgi:hypothetical protein
MTATTAVASRRARRPSTIPRALPIEPRPFDVRALHKAGARVAGVVVHQPTGCSACAGTSAGMSCLALLGLARLLGVHHKQLLRWRVSGLTTGQADALAGRLRLHPSWIWPHWWENEAPAGPLEAPAALVSNELRSEQCRQAARARWDKVASAA